jgi:hypothetical protein
MSKETRVIFLWLKSLNARGSEPAAGWKALLGMAQSSSLEMKPFWRELVSEREADIFAVVVVM